MDWKREAADKLRLLEDRRKALSGMSMELGEMSGVTLNDRALRRELELRREEIAVWVALVEGALDGLDEEERLILDRFYIRPVRDRVDWLCQELGCEQAAVYRRKDKALRHFATVLYG